MAVEGLKPMYSMKTVKDSSCVFHYGSSMYGMKNVLQPADTTGSINKVDDQTYCDLERDQNLIFDYIKVIKKQIEELRQILLKRSRNSEDIVSSKSTTDKMSPKENAFDKSGVTHEIVLNGDVRNPPYCLLALHLLAKESLSLRITSHHHSSLNKLPDDLKTFSDLNKRNKSGGTTLAIRLIWKESETCVVLSHVPLSGEVSLLRFVHSCVDQQTLDPSTDSYLQHQLDLLHNGGPSSLENIIKGTEYLISNRLTVLDIALWSSIKKSKPSESPKLTKWFENFDRLVSAN